MNWRVLLSLRLGGFRKVLEFGRASKDGASLPYRCIAPKLTNGPLRRTAEPAFAIPRCS
jgi:hypothetical protein